MPSPSDSPAKPPHRVHEEFTDFVEDAALQVTGYAFGGKEVDPESRDCVCKKVFDPNTQKRSYFLKFATAGPERGQLPNPQGARWDVTSLAKGRYEFRPVKVDDYDLYLAFLKSGNPVYFRQIGRM